MSNIYSAVLVSGRLAAQDEFQKCACFRRKFLSQISGTQAVLNSRSSELWRKNLR